MFNRRFREMNLELKDTFIRMKPICDMVMVCPSPENVVRFTAIVSELRKEDVQELQQYFLFPFITHIRSAEIKKKYEQQRVMIDAMRVVLEKITVTSFEMCMKIETGLLTTIFDKTKPGMIAEVPEELKLSIMKCLTALILHVDSHIRMKLLKTQVPLLAQTVFVSVHMAKLEKLRALRLAAIHNVTSHTLTHEALTDDKYQIKDAKLEPLMLDMLSGILPGVLAALQDVAMCRENPGHAIVVAALNATHRVLCLTMHDKRVKKNNNITTEDFAKLIALKNKPVDNDVSKKDFIRRSPEWYAMAGEKLTLVVQSLVPLGIHEHYKVRMELAILCSRILNECNTALHPSIPVVLDMLISMSRDSQPEVAEFSGRTVDNYLASTPPTGARDTLDCIRDNLLATLTNLPRVLNNIDSGGKLAALNLVHGYIRALSGGARPQRLTAAMTSRVILDALCGALRQAATHRAFIRLLMPRMHNDLDDEGIRNLASGGEYMHGLIGTRHCVIALPSALLLSPPPANLTAPPLHMTPWSSLVHLDKECVKRLREICQLLAVAECAELILDQLLELFQQPDCELAYLINCFGSAPNASCALAKRILDTYLEEELWYLPLEVRNQEPTPDEDTLDIEVYNPRGWIKDSVPGLFEGATEIRYTGISYDRPRDRRVLGKGCKNAIQAQRNVSLCCLLTEGVGEMALKLREQFQPYLLKTLCLCLERVGSRYELVRGAGLRALDFIATAGGHSGTPALLAANADYITSQVNRRIKKVWNIQSGLEILSVVMQYSDISMLDYLYGIMEEVLQSCDKYHDHDPHAYLQVFLAFIKCITKWFKIKDPTDREEKTDIAVDVISGVVEFAKSTEVAERLLGDEMEVDDDKSAEEMYKEDVKMKEENVLDYDDTVAKEKEPPPRYVVMTERVLRRCVQLAGGIVSAGDGGLGGVGRTGEVGRARAGEGSRRMEAGDHERVLAALRALRFGLCILSGYEDQLLPLVHAAWPPLCHALAARPSVAKKALDLLVVMATLSKDFIRARAEKDVFPLIYKYLNESRVNSELKEKTSAYLLSGAYVLQSTALDALPQLAVELSLGDEALQQACRCVAPYLSRRQPESLQELAVDFFKEVLHWKYGVGWYFLRGLCANEELLEPPEEVPVPLAPVLGSPYWARDADYDQNFHLIFRFVS